MKNKNLSIYALILQLFIFYFINFVTSIHSNKNELRKSTIKIQGYSPEQNDDYVSVAMKAEPGYIGFFTVVQRQLIRTKTFGEVSIFFLNYFLREGGATCNTGNHILYAWARNAPPLVLPENVGFAVGNEGDSVQYIILQIHYATPFEGNVIDFSGVTLHLTSQKPQYLAGVYLFVSGMPIQPGHSAFYTNVSCSYNSDTKLYPFAFRTHTHEMGRLVSAYVKKSKTKNWLQIGKRNPLWPQLFQLRETPLVIENGDFLAAICRYDSSDKTEEVPMGSMGSNEMCNFYMMYYQDKNDPDPFPYGSGCFGNSASFPANEYPEEGTRLLPQHPELTHQANHSAEPFGVLERHKIEELADIQLGQIAGLTFDQNGNLVVFHRAGRFWNQKSVLVSLITFNENNVFTDKTPINDPVILIIDVEDNEKPKLLAKYGEKRFYLPHGIFVDHNAFIYTTDVGSHQVIKWRINNGEFKQVWSLGVKFMPGSDKNHFCKPAGVVVSKMDGSVYVADGYCNNRVVKFSSEGRFISQFGEFNSGRSRLGQFSLPHDITLDEQGGRIFVADRENGRTQVFSISDHKPLFDIKNPNFYSTVYSVYYQQGIGLLFVPGFSPPTQDGKPRQIQVYVVQPNSTHVQYAFRPQSGDFQLPHVLRANGNNVWVGEIAGSRGILWHFEIHSSKIVPSLNASKQKEGGKKLINGNESQRGNIRKLENGGKHEWKFGFKPLKTSDLADVEQDFTSSDSEDEILEGSRKRQESGF
uniref:Peptidylglycine monooxygenase n=1 Tax=Meloidogyne floridensis TaxID=298350 RepID=A0A915P101_9BILA